MPKREDIVLTFGPQSNYKLHIPISDLDNLRETAYSFMEAGVALKLYADDVQPLEKPQKTSEQLLFDWNE